MNAHGAHKDMGRKKKSIKHLIYILHITSVAKANVHRMINV